MSEFPFDPDANKVPNNYGGFDANEKGLIQYPRKDLTRASRTVDNYTSTSARKSDYPKCYSTSKGKNYREIPKTPKIFDSVTTHYRRFIEDPGDLREERNQEDETLEECTDTTEPEVVSCCEMIPKLKSPPPEVQYLPPLRKPIDPIHWSPTLFDTRYEKYYLRNLLMQDPYRNFLTSCAVATKNPHYFTEYKESYSGNPVIECSSSGRILGLGKPTDISEPCHWKRYKTQKLRDVIFTHDKDPIDSHLDWNDPKRYSPWPRLRMSYDLMLEGNYRPRPLSGVEYSVTTLLPAVATKSKLWAI